MDRGVHGNQNNATVFAQDNCRYDGDVVDGPPSVVVSIKRSSSSDSLGSMSTISTEDLSVSSCSDSREIEEGAALLYPRKPIGRTLLPCTGTAEQALKLCFGAVGIYTCYLFYGDLQEDIFRYRNPADDSHFTQVWFLQFLECVCNVLVGVVGRSVFGGTTPKSFLPFMQTGASQVFAKVLTSLALAHGISFPVCILAKSAKMVPVMLGQLLLGGSSYGLQDYIFAGAVVAGTAMLSLGKAQASGASGGPTFSNPSGLFFIVMSLVMDGVTGGLQKRLKKESKAHPPTTYDFMLFTNLSMGAVALTISILVGDFARGLLFLAENPVIQQKVWISCILSAIGQSFVFFVVAHFDPMVCATITTTRKIISVVWSVSMKGHRISQQGYAGLVIAIGGILLGLHEKLSNKTGPRLPDHKKGHPKEYVTLC